MLYSPYYRISLFRANERRNWRKPEERPSIGKLVLHDGVFHSQCVLVVMAHSRQNVTHARTCARKLTPEQVHDRIACAALVGGRALLPTGLHRASSGRVQLARTDRERDERLRRAGLYEHHEPDPCKRNIRSRRSYTWCTTMERVISIKISLHRT